ncbi:hypothetical protein PLESTB_001392400 [Pleodorina starrii]|uniref:Uncharacterized protein n=1 Tax=Pleodorina starrii TaxID=330485 RepID=A0A9W6F7J6_9CHLO|nr:hypothetical protein PLESTB_001392400 [Pleodorina starrii]GLC75206.1 hypothetical protein PLESTF_001606800 [Pleodorina starrii]
MRTSMHLLNRHKPTDGFLWHQTYFGHHPMDPGHKAMSDLAVHLIQEVAIGLITTPVSQEEREWRNLQIPEPMYKGNFEPNVTSCLTELTFAGMAVANQGWQWIDEGTVKKPKWGYVATTPGSTLVLRLGTPNSVSAASLAADKLPNSTFPVLLHYLASYASMGQMSASCLGGCKCNLTKIDGFVKAHVSVTSMAGWDVRWAQRDQPCDIQLIVLNETRSDGHKVKVSGVVIVSMKKLASSISVAAWQEPY